MIRLFKIVDETNADFGLYQQKFKEIVMMRI